MGPAVAVDHGLGDLGLHGQHPLDALRRDVVAAGADDDVLLAVGDGEVAVGVDDAHVARVQPAVPDRLGGGFRVAPVALHDQFPAHQDLAVGGDLHLDAGKGGTHRVYLDLVGPVGGDHRRRFRLSVALQDAQAQRREEEADVGVQRRPARHQGLEPAAEAGPHLVPHQLVQHGVDEALARRQAAAALIAPGAQLQGLAEQLLLDAAGLVDAPEDAAVHGLVEPGHRRHDGRPGLPHVGGQGLDALGVVDLGADGHGKELARRVLVGMGEGQEGQEHLVVQAQFHERLPGAGAVVQDRPVVKHHALRRAAGARGINDAGGVAALPPARQFDDVFGSRPAPFQDVVQMQHLDAPVMADIRRVQAGDELHPVRLVGGGEHPLGQLPGGDDGALGAAVAEDVEMVLGRVGDVCGDRDGAHRHDGYIRHQP